MPPPAPAPAPGFHIGPLMASVGGVGVVLGLATQDLLSNIAAAVSLVRVRWQGCSDACAPPRRAACWLLPAPAP